MNATKTTIENGTYFLHPEGSAWIAAEFRNGKCRAAAYQADAGTHAAANDRWAGVVPSEEDVEVGIETAAKIVAEVMGDDTDASMVIVTKA